MRRGNAALAVLLAFALVGSSVAAVAQVAGRSGDAQQRRGQATLAQQDHHEPWIAKGYGGKAVSGRQNNEQQQFPGNTTWTINYHEPGATNITWTVYASGFSENIRLHFNRLEQRDFYWAECTSSQHAKVFGIDRGNDESGTKTDESLLTSYKTVQYYDDGVRVHFYEKETIGGSPVKITVDDQIVARVGPCVHAPDEPGWYRATGYVNGSTKMDAKTDYVIYGASQFTYICEGCDSREEARKKLGPPPTTCPASDRFGLDSKKWTCRTSDGKYYTHGSGGSGGSGGSEQGGTPTATATATVTPTPSQNSNQATATVTATQSRNPNEATASPTSDGKSTATSRATRQSPTGQRGQRQSTASATGSVPRTPTISGPGFGALLSLVGLLGGTLLALRRT